MAGSTDRLAAIVLHGLEGPLRIKGTDYSFNAAMPGLAANRDLQDQEIAAILTYVRNAFSLVPHNFEAEQIKKCARATLRAACYLTAT
ncbi:MAG: hypothetical protein IPL65_09535 [Lewinellaceae bacterium]|nr:hypothetical protein [Lewinellaceae bacterium]